MNAEDKMFRPPVFRCEITKDRCSTTQKNYDIRQCEYIRDKKLLRLAIEAQKKAKTLYEAVIIEINNNYVDSVKEKSG
jgi:hypothetical protein